MGEYSECTSSESTEPWCSTQTTAEGMHVEGKWGVCGEACFDEGGLSKDNNTAKTLKDSKTPSIRGGSSTAPPKATPALAQKLEQEENSAGAAIVAALAGVIVL